MTTLKNGSKGDEVKTLQENLVKMGYFVKTDGQFGPSTEEAVKQLQKDCGYDIDGLVGDATAKLVTKNVGMGWKSPSATPAGPTGPKG